MLLEPQSIYLSLAAVLSDKGAQGEASLEFVGMMVQVRTYERRWVTSPTPANDIYPTQPNHTPTQTLNLILLTAAELEGLRSTLRDSFDPAAPAKARETFVALFGAWCHNPVATLR